MMYAFRIFIKSIAPQSRGVRALLLCLFLIPLATDAMLMMTGTMFRSDIYMSGMLVNGYLRYIPWMILYLFVFFLLSWCYQMIVSTKNKKD